MKTGHYIRKTHVMFLVSSLLVCQAGILSASAQSRPAPGGRRVEQGQNVNIRSVSGIRRSDMVATPEYSTSARESQRGARQWGCITVEYDTAEEWTNQLEFRYFVLVQHPDTKAYSFYKRNVTYIDIAEGRHRSTVFVRPNTIDRYGPIQRIAVEVWDGGRRTAMASAPEDREQWWVSGEVNRAVMEGRIRVDENAVLNRSETPFIFVAYDNYETIKPE